MSLTKSLTMPNRMPNTIPNTVQALADLFAQHDHFPTVEHDSQWPSECEITETLRNGQIQWQPIKRQTPGDFTNVEHALDIDLHPDINHLFGSYYSGEVDFTFDHNGNSGPVTLLQVWNDEDFANLQQNMIGHIMMKRQLKQPVTLFFALTDEEDKIISLLNDSGEVWLESVGQQPHLKLADSVAEFLSLLKIPGQV